MRISLFDEADLKLVEDMLVRAITRSARIIAKQDLIKDLSTAVGTQVTQAPPAPPQPQHVPTILPPAPQQVQPIPQAPSQTQTPSQELRESRRAKTVPLTKIIPTVPDRPNGFITTDQAWKLLNKDDDKTWRNQLSHWIRDREVEAVIVANCQPLKPTKGVPGRVMVKTSSVQERERLRVQRQDPRERITAARQKWGKMRLKDKFESATH